MMGSLLIFASYCRFWVKCPHKAPGCAADAESGVDPLRGCCSRWPGPTSRWTKPSLFRPRGRAGWARPGAGTPRSAARPRGCGGAVAGPRPLREKPTKPAAAASHRAATTLPGPLNALPPLLLSANGSAVPSNGRAVLPMGSGQDE